VEEGRAEVGGKLSDQGMELEGWEGKRAEEVKVLGVGLGGSEGSRCIEEVDQGEKVGRKFLKGPKAMKLA
jgi:hypothetical protein